MWGHLLRIHYSSRKRCWRKSEKDRIETLFEQIPDTVRLKENLNLPSGMSELEVVRRMETLAEKNRVYRHIFRGAGAYNHYIPAAVQSIAGKEEFLTAYTPYQPEISQEYCRRFLNIRR